MGEHFGHDLVRWSTVTAYFDVAVAKFAGNERRGRSGRGGRHAHLFRQGGVKPAMKFTDEADSGLEGPADAPLALERFDWSAQRALLTRHSLATP